VSDMNLSEIRYDKATRTLITVARVESAVGAVKGIVGIILTQKGFIQVAACGAEAEFDENRALLEEIILNIQLDESLAYRAGLLDNLRAWSQNTFSSIAAAVIMALLVIGGQAGIRQGLKRWQQRSAHDQEARSRHDSIDVKSCPICGSINAPGALQCRCGHDFVNATSGDSVKKESSVATRILELATLLILTLGSALGLIGLGADEKIVTTVAAFLLVITLPQIWRNKRDT